MASSPLTTARPTSSSTTPPSRSTDSAPFRRTSGSSTPLAVARRGRRRKRSTRCNTVTTHARRGGPGFRSRPFSVCSGSGRSGHRAGNCDQAAVAEVTVRRLGRVPGQLDAAQALVPPVAAAGELVHRVAAVEVVRVVHRVVVLCAVRVGPLHVGEVELQVDGEGAVHGGGGGDT